MKFFLVPLIALATSVKALPEPTNYTPPVGKRALEKRTNSGTVEVDGLKYRTCPLITCTAIGQYPIGTHTDIVCYTQDNTTVINGDP
ncbi:hypothetical protein BYT27DRAFT_7197685 [Phlegmacium glaucopus]|nr:hypothetical protein BYT27DRAFT_7197685 [Phlegmacium glaucopus]